MLFIGHTPTEKHSFSLIHHLTETLVIARDFVSGNARQPQGCFYWVCLNWESIICFFLHLSDTSKKGDGSRQNQEPFKTSHTLCYRIMNIATRGEPMVRDFTFRVTDQDRADIAKAARAKGISRSVLVRMILLEQGLLTTP